jgi:hypothetical protein
MMQVSNPTWNPEESAYIFPLSSGPVVVGQPISFQSDAILPDVSKETSILHEILTSFLEKTKQYFVSPLSIERMKKYLTHHIGDTLKQEEQGFFKPSWQPVYLKMKSNEFALYWSIVSWEKSEPLIQSDFFRPQTPTPHSPEREANLRTILIQNTVDSTLIPVGDLPLSDLPPLNFIEESPEKKEVRRRIREARLKVELAKLKAKRMEQKYYEKYGEPGLESDESSLESSETDSDGLSGKYSYP